MDIVIQKLTPQRVNDFFRFFDKIAFSQHPEWGCECYCCYFHATSRQEWQDRTAAENRRLARKMILAGSMQGLLAYVDGVPVGWCHYDWKNSLPGLRVFYPRAFAAAEPEQIGAIICFTIAQGYRHQGIAGRLLDAVCQDLAAQGCRLAEAYPMQEDETDEENYHGPLSMYLKHGFTVSRKIGQQAVVQKMLG